MKRKLVKMFVAVMAAFLLSFSFGFTTYAYADTSGQYDPPVTSGSETTKEEDTSSGVVVIEEDITEKDKDKDKNKDKTTTGVTVTEERTGLTPSGNMNLVDDLTDEEDMEFLTVSTRDGHYFYIVIEKSKDGENVHFLNQVDVRDLLSIMSEEEVKEYQDSQKETEEPVVVVPVETEDPKPSEPEKKSTNPFVTLGVFGIIGAAVAGGYYFLKIKPNRDNDGYDEDLEFEDDADYVEETENEDEPTFRVDE